MSDTKITRPDTDRQQRMIDNDRLRRNARRSDEATVAEALKRLLHAVCGETGFANAVRQTSGLAYPWPALEDAEAFARDALSAYPAPPSVQVGVTMDMVNDLVSAELDDVLHNSNGGAPSTELQNKLDRGKLRAREVIEAALSASPRSPSREGEDA